jgi:peptidoglycan biosynthesis protein MviN/MurJ (putative lipid II flippase)
MAVCIIQIQQPLGWWIDASILIRTAWLGLCIGVGGASYFTVLLALGIRPSQFVLKQV